MNLKTTLFPIARLIRTAAISLWLAFALTSIAPASDLPGPEKPLPQDVGLPGLKQELRRLRTTARLMHTDAHPDDEDGGMLTLESRGKGADVLLLTLNRGEGGQNKIGSNLFDVLGVVRVLELLAADRYYDVSQAFTRVADFGFTKSAAETLDKWHGHDPALSDMVRVIRLFRPDVLVSRFQGNEKDGHGQHQVAGILTREAFRAAADPKRFPEQLQEGLSPWQVKKLYIDNVHPPEDYTLALDTGAVDPALGMSYVQFAMQGLKHQLSQGAGSWNVQPGPHISHYKLVDSVLPTPAPGTHENDFFDGIDTSIVGLASRLQDADGKKLPSLRAGLQELQKDVDEASAAADRNPTQAAAPLLSGAELSRHLLRDVVGSDISVPARLALQTELSTKAEQFNRAANLALDMTLQASVDAPPSVREGFMAVPGESFTATVNLHQPVKDGMKLGSMQMDVPPGWTAKRISPIGTGKNGDLTTQFRITTAPDAAYTRPCDHRPNGEAPIYSVENDACAYLPIPPSVVRAVASYTLATGQGGHIEAPVEVEFVQGAGVLSRRPLAVGPRFSISVSPVTALVPTGQPKPVKLSLEARSNLPQPADAQIELRPPAGWTSQPRSVNAHFAKPGENRTFDFSVTPPADLREGRVQINALLTSAGKSYKEGYTVVTRPDLGSAIYYQPASQTVSAVDVKVPANLKVGYIMGAGDEIPTALRQIGMNVDLISPQELAGGDLSKYGSIAVGIRAYDTRDDVRANNKRLLDYVSKGGTLVVQYNAGVGDFNSGHFTPYPAELSRQRVSVEEAPVEVLSPSDPIFHFPNQITERDFANWVQERGLYFMDSWDPQFTPLLSSHDPGEQPQKGGLLKAHFGKGIYIYTGYAFFRQLPGGVPGAVRLFVNLVSAGHETNAASVGHESGTNY